MKGTFHLEFGSTPQGRMILMQVQSQGSSLFIAETEGGGRFAV